MGEQDALKTITINAAKQLGIDKRTGSLEVGKDADLAVFNGHPLNRCQGRDGDRRGRGLLPALRQAHAVRPAEGFKPAPVPNLTTVAAQSVLLFIDGKPVAPTSKHTKLYERYQERLREVQKGQMQPGKP